MDRIFLDLPISLRRSYVPVVRKFILSIPLASIVEFRINICNPQLLQIMIIFAVLLTRIAALLIFKPFCFFPVAVLWFLISAILLCQTSLVFKVAKVTENAILLYNCFETLSENYNQIYVLKKRSEQ